MMPSNPIKAFTMSLVATVILLPAVASAGSQVIKTGQAEYVYPSETGTYLKSASFLLCADLECNVPSKKLQYVRRTQAATPLRIDPHKVMPKPVAVVPPSPLRETLYFGFDSFNLSKLEARKIEEIKRKILVKESKAVITGYTDKIGSQLYNDKLALKRAETVYRHLDYGTNAVVTGKGKCCYADESDNGKNRRVEVVIEKKVTPKAPARGGGRPQNPLAGTDPNHKSFQTEHQAYKQADTLTHREGE